MLIIGPDPFISQSSPDYSPQPRIDFSHYEISGPDICSLICDTNTMYYILYRENSITVNSLRIMKGQEMNEITLKANFQEGKNFLYRWDFLGKNLKINSESSQKCHYAKVQKYLC